jgi:dGTPase
MTDTEITRLWKAADALHGCLQHVRTNTGRRRYGLERDSDPLHMDDVFAADQAKIASSKLFRTMQDKTQVFTNPACCMVRTRMTHIMEVYACAIVACNKLGLNLSLAQAIALGHDMGHVPFGHQGEEALAQIMGKPFCHENWGVIVAQKIERKGAGLNLCFETLDGMRGHSGNTAHEDMSPEAWLVRYVDKFAYIFADISDLIQRIRVPLPKAVISLADEFGSDQRSRTSTAIAGLVIESAEQGKVSFEHSDLAQKFAELRKQMYGVYRTVTEQRVRPYVEQVLHVLDQLEFGNPHMLFALMTDSEALHLAAQTMPNVGHLKDTGLWEIKPHLEAIGAVDMCDPDLDW